MQLYLVYVCLIVGLASWTHAIDKQKVHEAAKKLVSDCQSQVGASAADVEALKKHQMPESQAGLCLLECVFDKSQIMKDGKYSKTGMVEAFRPVFGDDAAKMESLATLSEVCDKEVTVGDGDKCAIAKKIVECIVGRGKDHGFELPPPAQ